MVGSRELVDAELWRSIEAEGLAMSALEVESRAGLPSSCEPAKEEMVE